MELKAEHIAEIHQVQQHFHVLAVDDSLIDRKLLEKLLTISSCQVTCVESGDKALRYLGLLDDLDKFSSSAPSFSSPQQLSQSQQQEVKVNLIMTDYCMPGMTGYDLLKRLKGSSRKDIPVVVMSSENEPSRINMCMEEGAEEFLLKPLRLSDVKKLEPHLQKSLSRSSVDQIKDEETIGIGIGITNSDDAVTDDESNSKEDSNKNENNNTLSKRKAMNPEPSERRPKLKELQAAV